MKTFTPKLFISLLTLLIMNGTAQAQCISPDLKFANPVLVAGTDRAEGAIYKFPNITPGIDCYIKLVKLNGGAQLISMETPGQGYPDAWQPIINGPGTPLGNKSWIDWNISFRTTAGTNYAFTCLDISAIDVDGDNGNIGEFIESDGQTSYTVPFPTVLTVTNMGNGKVQAQGPVYNRVGIDTFSLDVRINYLFNGLDSIQLKIGQTVLGPGTGGATQRLNSIYFKRVTLTPFFILPVKYISFEAIPNDKKVDLNWQTDNEVNNSRYEVERSFDGNYFSTINVVNKALTTSSTTRKYTISDNATAFAGKEIVYYRIKQIDVNGKYIYSKTAMVRLSANKGIIMQLSPNPFNESVTVNFTSIDKGTALIKMRSLTGQIVLTKNVLINKGDNRVQIGGLGELAKGMYIAQIIINGVVADKQKIIKN